MVRYHVLAGTVLMVMLLIATPVLEAQTQDSDSYNYTTGVGFGPIVGWYKAKNADDGKFTGGAALRLKLSPSFAVEGSLTYRQEEYASGAIKARSWPVMVTGMLYPLPTIYGLIGAGWYFTTLTYDRARLPDQSVFDETTHKFGWHFGGGVEVPMGKASFTADIRYVFLNYDFKTLPGTSGTNSNFFVINAGVLFGL